MIKDLGLADNFPDQLLSCLSALAVQLSQDIHRIERSDDCLHHKKTGFMRVYLSEVLAVKSHEVHLFDGIEVDRLLLVQLLVDDYQNILEFRRGYLQILRIRKLNNYSTVVVELLLLL